MRPLPLLLGLLALATAWLGPLPALVPHAFVAHMTMHVVVVAVAAPLIALALSGGRWDPAARWPQFMSPVPVSLLELLVLWAWHAPLLHHASRSGGGALVLEQSMFLLVSLALWLSALGRGARAAAGIVALLMTSMHMTLLGALLALSRRVLYPHGHGALGLTALEDQQLGGVIMLVGAGTAYLIGGLALLRGLLRQTVTTEAKWP